MFRRSTFVLNTGVEDSDSQETQLDELRQLVDAHLQAELKRRKMKDNMHADNRIKRCGSELDCSESFSCSWATRSRTG